MPSASDLPSQAEIIEQMDRDYCARQLERINALATEAGPGARKRLQRAYFLACLTIWTTPTSLHGPFYRVAKAAHGALNRA